MFDDSLHENVSSINTDTIVTVDRKEKILPEAECPFISSKVVKVLKST